MVLNVLLRSVSYQNPISNATGESMEEMFRTSFLDQGEACTITKHLILTT